MSTLLVVSGKGLGRVALLALLATCCLLLPATAHAQAILPECFGTGVEQSYEGVKTCITSVGSVAIQWVFAIALIALMITGYLYITSLGNKAQAEQAKNSFLFITIGILVVLGAYLVVNTLGSYFINPTG